MFNCITDNIQVTERRKYCPCVPVSLLLPAFRKSSLFGRGGDKLFSPKQVVVLVVDVSGCFADRGRGISVSIRWLRNLTRES